MSSYQYTQYHKGIDFFWSRSLVAGNLVISFIFRSKETKRDFTWPLNVFYIKKKKQLENKVK